MVHTGAHEMSTPYLGCRPLLRPSTVDQRLGVLAKETERYAEQPFRGGEIHRIGVAHHDRLRSATKSKRAPEVFAAMAETGQAADCSQLILRVVDAFGKLFRL